MKAGLQFIRTSLNAKKKKLGGLIQNATHYAIGLSSSIGSFHPEGISHPDPNSNSRYAGEEVFDNLNSKLDEVYAFVNSMPESDRKAITKKLASLERTMESLELKHITLHEAEPEAD
jgi:hypothetical protein